MVGELLRRRRSAAAREVRGRATHHDPAARQLLDHQRRIGERRDPDQHVDALGDRIDELIAQGELDVAGGDLSRALRAARWGGQVSLVGLLAGGTSQLEMIPILTKNLRLQGISVGPRELFEQLNAAVAHHRIRPVIHQTYAFEDARTALLDLRAGAHVGKLVIRGAG